MERVLSFKYPFEFLDKANLLEELLTKNNIEFIFYKSDGYYPHEFLVRKSGKKWDDIYGMINSIKPAKYNFKKTHIEKIDGKLYNTIPFDGEGIKNGIDKLF